MCGFLSRLFYGNGVTPLPGILTALLFALQVCAAVTMTMVFPFLPKLVKSFGVTEQQTGYYAGMIASALFIGRVFCSLFWGYLSDTQGKKLAVLVTTCGALACTLSFGFSRNVTWAFVTRLLQGSFMGIIVISKSIVTDICDNTNLHVGMSILLNAFSVGLVIGPTVGGFLSFPVEKYPTVFEKDSIFDEFGILLPNLVMMSVLLVVAALTFVYLPPDKKKHSEYSKLVQTYDEEKGTEKKWFPHSMKADYLIFSFDTDVLPVCQPNHMYLTIKEPLTEKPATPCCSGISLNNFKNTKICQVLRSKDCVFTCVLYGVFSITAVAFDELFSLIASTSQEYNGFGLNTSEIGTVLLVSSFFLIFLQFTLMNKLTTTFGAKKMLFASLLVLASVFPILPQLSKFHNRTTSSVLLCLAHVTLRTNITNCFVSINIFLNNSAEPHVRGTVNGLGTTLSSVGRAIAPSLFGSIFAWSLRNVKGVPANVHPLGFPVNQNLSFYILSVASILTAIMGCYVPKGLQTKKEAASSTQTHTKYQSTQLTVSVFTNSSPRSP